MSYDEILDRLLALQNLDSAILALEKELDQLPRNLAAAREDEAAVQGKHEAAQAEVDAVLKRRRALEQEVETATQTVFKYENDKLKVRTNDEFRAINNQIDGVQAQKSALEDQVLQTYEDEERSADVARKLAGELERVKEMVAERAKQIEARAEEDRVQLAQVREQAEAARAALDPKLLTRYDAIRQRKSGLAVVPVVRHSCGGCQAQQPPQVLNRVRKKDALVACESCGRYLVGVEEGAPA